MLTVMALEPRLAYQHQKLICQCECGVISSVLKYKVIVGDARSCGSGRCRSALRPVVSAVKRVFRRHYPDHGLKIEQFYELSQMNCTYCGATPGNIAYSDRFILPDDRYFYNGLDKLHPKNGYVIGNIVPSCINCNRIKYKSTISEFDEWLNNVRDNFLTINFEEYHQDLLNKVSLI